VQNTQDIMLIFAREQEVQMTLQPHSLKGRTRFRDNSLVSMIILKWMLGNKTLRRDLE